MSQELTLPANFGAVSKHFAGASRPNDDLGSGVASSYGVIGIKGKVWSTKYQGTETKMMRDDGDGARGSIEVIIVKSSSAVSKIFYKGGYVDGSNMAPDCWSSNGIVPDAGAQNKQHATCANCPMNAWGSRVTDSGKNGKACADSRRVAVVPMNDIENDMFGGPMLLRIPAASLKDLQAYGKLLDSYGYPYYACATRIAFDPNEAYPKFVFSAIRPLTDAEATKIIAMRDDERVKRLLNESTEYAAPAERESLPAPSPFEQPFTPKAATPVAPSATPEPAPKAKKPVSKPAPAEVDSTPKGFDDMLNDML